MIIKRGRQSGHKLRKFIEVDAVFDIETEGWDQFVVGRYLTSKGGSQEFWHGDEDAFVDRLLSIEGSVWAHNGGKYDFLWLVDHIIKRDRMAKLTMAGARIISMSVGKTNFRDSYALIPFALEEAAGIGGEFKLGTGLICSCGEVGPKGCGGFCRIKRSGMTSEEKRRLGDYLAQDCKATLGMLLALQEFASGNDMDLAGTIGTAAWGTIQRWLKIDDAEWKRAQLYNDCRDAYYGGRVQVFRNWLASGFRYDINSAYPAALVETPIPIGAPEELTPRLARKAYEAGRAGIFRVHVRAPDIHIPVLPTRTKDRVVYPIGQFHGRYTSVELQEAESLGYKLDFLGGCVWPEEAPLLSAFCNKVWGLRSTLGKKSPLGKWLKWFANSPTGKLAQRPEHDDVQIIGRDDIGTINLCPADYECGGHCGYKCCPHRCTGKCGRWRVLDSAMRVWRRSFWRLPSSGYIHWAAFLTSSTRVKLGRQLRAADGDYTAAYCDTDSCFASNPRTENIGTGLGQWNPEGEFRTLQVEGPKAYRYLDPETSEVVARVKGIPDAKKHWDDIVAGRAVKIDRGVESILQAVGKGTFFNRKNFSRALHKKGLMYGDRKLGSDGRTYPLDANVWLCQGKNRFR